MPNLKRLRPEIDPTTIVSAVRAIQEDPQLVTEPRITHATIMSRLKLTGGSGSHAGYALTAGLMKLKKKKLLTYDTKHGWRVA